MKKVLDYLNTLEHEFIDHFYSVIIYKDELRLQGHVNKQNLIAVQHLGTVNINDTWITVDYSVDEIQIHITLTL